MKTASIFLVLAASLIVTPQGGLAQGSPSAEEEIGAVRLRGTASCLDTTVRRGLDSLVPKLAALESGRIVKVEACASWGKGREERVRNSLLLALEAQRYLRTKLNPRLNLFIAAVPGCEAVEGAFIRVVTFPDSFAAVHVSTVRDRQR